ncbi:cyclin-T1-3-like [Canna indica]|uniref:Cyclin-T1-3-like n=1 Tax=Canna indica TaxID=4628 RepID=A0AAQ3QBU4_9LILI|nr:cyclin-T1-3-like [Canna indica]
MFAKSLFSFLFLKEPFPFSHGLVTTKFVLPNGHGHLGHLEEIINKKQDELVLDAVVESHRVLRKGERSTTHLVRGFRFRVFFGDEHSPVLDLHIGIGQEAGGDGERRQVSGSGGGTSQQEGYLSVITQQYVLICYYEMAEASTYRFSHDRHEEVKLPGATWYSSRKEIEENSPSRRHGIDLKKETYLRKSYCTFLQDFGMRLKVPQVTIATAVVFCHRFFLRQSHAKNDRRTIATVCMFLAGKVEETPRPLKDVILVSYEIIHKKDPAAVQRIKQREVYEQQKELILLGERLVLATLGFDLNVQHPYKPLVEAIKKFKIAQNALAQVAWNFVNDGLRTSLCLQFKPHHIAAGAIFLAAKFLKVKLPSDGEKVWWQEFDVTPRQLEEISNQMLELYEQNRPASSHGNETEASSASGANHRAPARAPVDVEEPTTQSGYTEVSVNATMESACLASSSTHSHPEHVHLDKHGSHEPRTATSDNKMVGAKDSWHHHSLNNADTFGSRSHHGPEQAELVVSVTDGMAETRERINFFKEGSKVKSPMMDAIKKIDKDKVKAALEKRRKSRPDVAKKVDLLDEDLIERELEQGIELAVEDERNKPKSHSRSKPTYTQEPWNSNYMMENGYHASQNPEEGELSMDIQDI